MDDASVTRWVQGLAEGQSRAEEEIWHLYFQRLVERARGYLKTLPRRTADEEDIALSALNSFFLGARAGRFPRLADRDDLWKLLLVIAARKAMAQKRRHFAAFRPDRHIADGGDQADLNEQIEAILGAEPSPDFAAEWAEELQSRLAELPDETTQQIAILRLEGHTNREIAAKLGTYEVKIERKLRLIRKYWTHAAKVRSDDQN